MSFRGCSRRENYNYAALSFGLRSAPKIFTALADALEWMVRRNGVKFLYDFIICGDANSQECHVNLQMLIDICKYFGVPLAEESGGAIRPHGVPWYCHRHHLGRAATPCARTGAFEESTGGMARKSLFEAALRLERYCQDLSMAEIIHRRQIPSSYATSTKLMMSKLMSGLQTCHLYNAKDGPRCTYTNCKFVHRCAVCKGPYARYYCWQKAGGEGAQRKRPRQE